MSNLYTYSESEINIVSASTPSVGVGVLNLMQIVTWATWVPNSDFIFLVAGQIKIYDMSSYF
jgi:hypothetical protein